MDEFKEKGRKNKNSLVSNKRRSIQDTSKQKNKKIKRVAKDDRKYNVNKIDKRDV